MPSASGSLAFVPSKGLHQVIWRSGQQALRQSAAGFHGTATSVRWRDPSHRLVARRVFNGRRCEMEAAARRVSDRPHAIHPQPILGSPGVDPVRMKLNSRRIRVYRRSPNNTRLQACRLPPISHPTYRSSNTPPRNPAARLCRRQRLAPSVGKELIVVADERASGGRMKCIHSRSRACAPWSAEMRVAANDQLHRALEN